MRLHLFRFWPFLLKNIIWMFAWKLFLIFCYKQFCKVLKKLEEITKIMHIRSFICRLGFCLISISDIYHVFVENYADSEFTAQIFVITPPKVSSCLYLHCLVLTFIRFYCSVEFECVFVFINVLLNDWIFSEQILRIEINWIVEVWILLYSCMMCSEVDPLISSYEGVLQNKLLDKFKDFLGF